MENKQTPQLGINYLHSIFFETRIKIGQTSEKPVAADSLPHPHEATFTSTKHNIERFVFSFFQSFAYLQSRIGDEHIQHTCHMTPSMWTASPRTCPTAAKNLQIYHYHRFTYYLFYHRRRTTSKDFYAKLISRSSLPYHQGHSSCLPPL